MSSCSCSLSSSSFFDPHFLHLSFLDFCVQFHYLRPFLVYQILHLFCRNHYLLLCGELTISSFFLLLTILILIQESMQSEGRLFWVACIVEIELQGRSGWEMHFLIIWVSITILKGTFDSEHEAIEFEVEREFSWDGFFWVVGIVFWFWI